MSIKRIAKFLLLIVALFIVAVGVLLAATFMGRKPISNGADIGGIRIVQDGIVAVGVVPLGAREVALVDAGNDPAGHAILEELTRRQLGPEAVTTILVTHGHPDHIAAITVFPNARVMALDAEVPLIEGRVASIGPLPKWWAPSPTGITVHRALRDGERFALASGANGSDAARVQVFAVPGHTPGSAAYLIDGVLFIGDAADIASSGTLQGAPWIFSESQAENRASLVRLSQRLTQEQASVTALVPSHSGDAGGIAALTAYAAGRKQADQ
jgi:hydroxyacylglutathione hydrolase